MVVQDNVLRIFAPALSNKVLPALSNKVLPVLSVLSNKLPRVASHKKAITQ